MDSKLARRRAIGFIVAATLLWSIPALAIKYLAGHMDIWTQNLVRFTSASVFLWVACLFMAPRGSLLSGGVLLRVLPAFAAVMAYQYLYTRAFYRPDVWPGVAYMLIKSTVFFTAVLSCLFFADERRVMRDRWFIVGAVLSVAGLAGFFMVTADAAPGARAAAASASAGLADAAIFGVAIILASSVCWSLYTVLIKLLVRRGSPLVAYTYICTLMTVVFAVLALTSKDARVEPPAELKWEVWMWIVAVASGALCVGAAHVLFYYSIRTLGTTVCGTVSLSNTFLPVVLSFLIFGERITLWHVGAGALLIAGAVFTLQAEPVESEQ